MSRDDTVLVRQVLDGNRQAFETLVERHKGLVFARVVGQTGRFAGAEEIVQDAFMKLWEVREKLKDDSNLKNYLYTITKNNCLSQLRKEH